MVAKILFVIAMLVSIIIPVYNAQRTIRRCLESVLHQTYHDIEIVVVNDGSIDNSIILANRALANYPNKVFVDKKTNEGPEAARVSGILASHGQYVMFLDADDYLDSDAVRIMVNAMCQYQADMVQCSCRVFITITSKIKLHWKKRKGSTEIRLIKKADFMKNEYMSFFGMGSFSVTAWGKLFKREYLDDIKKAGLFFGEDLYLNMQVLPRLSTICIMSDALYHYERQGITSKFMPRFMEDVKCLYRLKIEKAEELLLQSAPFYATVELRNCLKTYVESMILHKVDTKEDIKQWIANELSDCTYDVFDWLKQQENCGRSPMSLAIMNKDVDAIYDLARKSVYEWNWKKIARRILVHLN